MVQLSTPSKLSRTPHPLNQWSWSSCLTLPTSIVFSTNHHLTTSCLTPLTTLIKSKLNWNSFTTPYPFQFSSTNAIEISCVPSALRLNTSSIARKPIMKSSGAIRATHLVRGIRLCVLLSYHWALWHLDSSKKKQRKMLGNGLKTSNISIHSWGWHTTCFQCKLRGLICQVLLVLLILKTKSKNKPSLKPAPSQTNSTKSFRKTTHSMILPLFQKEWTLSMKVNQLSYS